MAQSAAVTDGAQRVCDLYMPVKHFSQDSGILPWLAARANAWADSRRLAQENHYAVYYIDWTKVGYMVPRFLKSAFRLIAGALSASPEKTACIMIAPNAGSHGDCWGCASINQAQDEVESEAREEEHGLIMRRGALTLDGSPSRRVGYRPLLMLMNEGGKDSSFTKSCL